MLRFLVVFGRSGKGTASMFKIQRELRQVQHWAAARNRAFWIFSLQRADSRIQMLISDWRGRPELAGSKRSRGHSGRSTVTRLVA